MGMKSTPFHAKNGIIEPKKRYYFCDLVTDKNFSVVARGKLHAIRRAFKKAKHTDLLFQCESPL
jgi:hypothetical protein